MKQFFMVVFGGLVAIGAGVVLAYSLAFCWKYVRPYIPWLGDTNHAATIETITGLSTDGTSISGTRRTIRYTASEEEDLINAAAQALPTAEIRLSNMMQTDYSR
jgi:hypothetical protein